MANISKRVARFVSDELLVEIYFACVFVVCLYRSRSFVGCNALIFWTYLGKWIWPTKVRRRFEGLVPMELNIEKLVPWAGAWRSTSLEWRFSILDPWIESDIPSSITRSPTFAYVYFVSNQIKFLQDTFSSKFKVTWHKN